VVADNRVVWLLVHGVPLHVWDEPLFKKVGSLFGKFLNFDDDTISRRRLDVARIQVSSKRKGVINDQLNLKVVGVDFCLWVVEEDGGRRWPPEQGEMGGEEASSVCSREGDVVGLKLGCQSSDESSLSGCGSFSSTVSFWSFLEADWSGV